MRLDNLQALTAVVLAGSIAMERLVTVVKTIGPTIFGEPGVQPGGVFSILEDTRHVRKLKRTWTEEQWRRIKVLAVVLFASFVIAWLVADDTSGDCALHTSALCRTVQYGDKLSLPWAVYAILISGGSALWANVTGLVSALKDVKAEERKTVRDASAAPATVFVVNAAEKSGAGTNEPGGR